MESARVNFQFDGTRRGNFQQCAAYFIRGADDETPKRTRGAIKSKLFSTFHVNFIFNTFILAEILIKSRKRTSNRRKESTTWTAKGITDENYFREKKSLFSIKLQTHR